jgi:hypothetical protein
MDKYVQFNAVLRLLTLDLYHITNYGELDTMAKYINICIHDKKFFDYCKDNIAHLCIRCLEETKVPIDGNIDEHKDEYVSFVLTPSFSDLVRNTCSSISSQKVNERITTINTIMRAIAKRLKSKKELNDNERAVVERICHMVELIKLMRSILAL